MVDAVNRVLLQQCKEVFRVDRSEIIVYGMKQVTCLIPPPPPLKKTSRIALAGSMNPVHEGEGGRGSRAPYAESRLALICLRYCSDMSQPPRSTKPRSPPRACALEKALVRCPQQVLPPVASFATRSAAQIRHHQARPSVALIRKLHPFATRAPPSLHRSRQGRWRHRRRPASLELICPEG